jgi:hypothetical protein
MCKGRNGAAETKGVDVKRLTTCIVIVAALVVGVSAPFAQAAEPTPAELRALEIRGQALNHLCDDSTITGAAYASVCGTSGAGNRPTQSELNALEIRGQGLNELCSDSTLVGRAHARLCGTTGGTGNRPTEAELRALEIRGQAMNELAAGQATQVVRSGGFDWSDFGMGAGAMLGFVLLAGGIAAGAYYSRKNRVRPRTVS